MQYMMKETVKELAVLSRIRITDAECETIAESLKGLSDLANALERLPAQEDRFEYAVPATALREDTVAVEYSRDTLLRGAPAHDEETFLVPRTVEE